MSTPQPQGDGSASDARQRSGKATVWLQCQGCLALGKHFLNPTPSATRFCFVDVLLRRTGAEPHRKSLKSMRKHRACHGTEVRCNSAHVKLSEVSSENELGELDQGRIIDSA